MSRLTSWIGSAASRAAAARDRHLPARDSATSDPGDAPMEDPRSEPPSPDPGDTPMEDPRPTAPDGTAAVTTARAEGRTRRRRMMGFAPPFGWNPRVLLAVLAVLMLLIVMVVLRGEGGGRAAELTAAGNPLPAGWQSARVLPVRTAADGETGSLRDTVASAAGSRGATVVELAPATTYRLTVGCGAPTEDLNESGDLDVTGGSVLFLGNGSTISQECPEERVLHLLGEDNVLLDGVTLRGGAAATPLGTGSGGGLLSEGGADVGLVDTLVTDNHAQDNGGGVSVSGVPGSLTLDRSIVSGNSAGSAGGGVWVLGDLASMNATVTDNLAATNAGLVATDAELTFSTVVDNSTTKATGARQLGALSLQSFGSYIAGGSGAPASCSVDRTRTDGYNVSDDTSCGFGSGTGDLDDGPSDGVGLMGLYGADLPGRPPVTGSVLVDRVPPSVCLRALAENAVLGDEDALDGQGRSRVARDQGCDIGAVELPAGLVVPSGASAARVATATPGVATYTG